MVALVSLAAVGLAWPASAAAVPACTIVGTDGDDRLVGTDGDDVICELGGDDTLYGDPGNDVLYGGAGADALSGNAGTDTLFGGPGADSLSGGKGPIAFTARAEPTRSWAVPAGMSLTVAARPGTSSGASGRSTRS
ncbi:MAG: hypothetical protein OXG37_00975 [Actinomycetia bacterium]|nr:hypothetical protein [Actinomycetes bacterium]